MTSNRKAQGLPINTIILIAIGLLILVLFITFVLGGFKGVGGATSPDTQAIQAFAANCQTSCSEAATANNPASWCSYPNETIGGTAYSCGSVNSGSQSTCSLDNGSTVSWTSASCSKYH